MSGSAMRSGSRLSFFARNAVVLKSGLCCSGLLMAIASMSMPTRAQAPPSESAAMQQLHRAVKIAEQGDPAQALALTQALLEQHPDFAPALKFQGLLLEQTGHATEAAASYEKALKLAPNDADLLYHAGVDALVSGNVDRAIELLQHRLRLVPKDGDTLFYLAQAYHRNGSDQEALKAIAQCVRLEPENAAAWQKYGELLCSSGDNAAGLPLLLNALRLDPKLDRIDYDIALADLKLLNVDEAVKYSARAVAAQPNDVHALELLASAQVKQADWPSAAATFARMLAMQPEDADSLLGLGQCQVELKNNQVAVETLNHALQVDPTRLTAHFYLARAYAALGNAAEAEHQAALHHLMMEQLSFVRTQESEQRESAITAQARQLLREHREEEALSLYRGHFKGTSATAADAYVFIGKLELFLGSTDDGLRNLHHALEMDPKVRGAHTYEGILALKFGDLARAEGEFKAELANDPNAQNAIAELGEVRYRQERWQEAAEHLARSRTTTPELLYMLCDAYFHLGKVTEADLTAETLAAYAQKKPALMQGTIALLRNNGQTELAQRLADGMN